MPPPITAVIINIPAAISDAVTTRVDVFAVALILKGERISKI